MIGFDPTEGVRDHIGGCVPPGGGSQDIVNLAFNGLASLECGEVLWEDSRGAGARRMFEPSVLRD